MENGAPAASDAIGAAAVDGSVLVEVVWVVAAQLDRGRAEAERRGLVRVCERGHESATHALLPTHPLAMETKRGANGSAFSRKFSNPPRSTRAR